MSKISINLNETGIAVEGHPLGLLPRVAEVISALGEVKMRKFKGHFPDRLIYIVDECGLSFMISEFTGLLYWMGIALETPTWRPKNERDVTHFFSGDFALRGVTLPLRPLTQTMTDSLNLKMISEKMSITFVPHGKTISSITISFEIDEDGQPNRLGADHNNS
jgi:hypothetical protein